MMTDKKSSVRTSRAGEPARAKRSQAAGARVQKPRPSRKKLRGVPAIRAFFRTNKTPVYFVSPTPFNLLGLDRWLRGFSYVSYYDSFEGTHPHMFVPSGRATREFTSMADVCNHLLADTEVRGWLAKRGTKALRGKAAFVEFDERTEELAREIGLEIVHPSAELRHRIDSKIVTTRLGNEAGVPSVPNILVEAASYGELMSLAATAGLGQDLVVQTPYGDSGKTTFFIAGQEDWDRHADQLLGRELKAMRRIRCSAVAVEAVVLGQGTLVGPLMRDLTGHPQLTPYPGGWCGNDVYPTALPARQRARARSLTMRLGSRLSQEGYRGFFEVDYLADLDTGNLYLGEINPRISGASPMTHVSAGAYAELPLFLFHLLEYMDVDYELDIAEVNHTWSLARNVDTWAQALIKETDDVVELITEAPRTGVWRLEEGGEVRFVRRANDWHDLADEREAFYLRIAGPGDYRYRGADLGALVARGRFQTDQNELTERCRTWVEGLKSLFKCSPLPRGSAPPTTAAGIKVAMGGSA